MPNGHSGGFKITKSKLQAILESHPSTEKIANLNRSGEAAPPGLEAQTTMEVLEALRDFPYKEVSIEEQDGSSYIIWLDPGFYTGADLEGFKLCLGVDEGSPIFQELDDQYTPELRDQYTRSLKNLENQLTAQRAKRRVMRLLAISLLLGGLLLLVALLR